MDENEDGVEDGDEGIDEDKNEDEAEVEAEVVVEAEKKNNSEEEDEDVIADPDGDADANADVDSNRKTDPTDVLPSRPMQLLLLLGEEGDIDIPLRPEHYLTFLFQHQKRQQHHYYYQSFLNHWSYHRCWTKKRCFCHSLSFFAFFFHLSFSFFSDHIGCFHFFFTSLFHLLVFFFHSLVDKSTPPSSDSQIISFSLA
jgi:hypothetical protein